MCSCSRSPVSRTSPVARVSTCTQEELDGRNDVKQHWQLHVLVVLSNNVQHSC